MYYSLFYNNAWPTRKDPHDDTIQDFITMLPAIRSSAVLQAQDTFKDDGPAFPFFWLARPIQQYHFCLAKISVFVYDRVNTNNSRSSLSWWCTFMCPLRSSVRPHFLTLFKGTFQQWGGPRRWAYPSNLNCLYQGTLLLQLCIYSLAFGDYGLPLMLDSDTATCSYCHSKRKGDLFITFAYPARITIFFCLVSPCM